LGIPFNLDRLFDTDDPAYRVFVAAVIDRAAALYREAHDG
jgi:hypothetical protein